MELRFQQAGTSSCKSTMRYLWFVYCCVCVCRRGPEHYLARIFCFVVDNLSIPLYVPSSLSRVPCIVYPLYHLQIFLPLSLAIIIVWSLLDAYLLFISPRWGLHEHHFFLKFLWDLCRERARERERSKERASESDRAKERARVRVRARERESERARQERG